MPEGERDTNETPRPSTASGSIAPMAGKAWGADPDVPSALRRLGGIPLGLEQINEISRYASGAKESGADNSWNAAQKHFVRNHSIQNGQRVRKGSSDGE